VLIGPLLLSTVCIEETKSIIKSREITVRLLLHFINMFHVFETKYLIRYIPINLSY